MNYYRIEYAIDDEKGVFHSLWATNVYNSSGDDLLEYVPDTSVLEPCHLPCGIDARQVADAYLKVSKRQRIGDCLAFRKRREMIISCRTLEYLAKQGLRIDPEVAQVPLHVIDKSTENVRGEYKMLWPMREWCVVDEKWAKLEYHTHARTGKKFIYKVFRWILDPDKLPEWDLFKVRYGLTWLVTENVKVAIEKAKLAGFKFTPTDLLTQDYTERARLDSACPDIRLALREQILKEVNELKTAQAEDKKHRD